MRFNLSNFHLSFDCTFSQLTFSVHVTREEVCAGLKTRTVLLRSGDMGLGLLYVKKWKSTCGTTPVGSI